ncbi:MAG: alpha/beta hydrolase [Bacteroidetes bacterium]|nr:alpha/beta hydrolase [Bacteroidota bacterium]
MVIHAHGNGGNISYDIERMRRLQRIGLAVFAYDYRGYGKSEGSPSEDGVIIDAVAAYDHLRDTLSIPPAKIILWGTSLGGAVSVQVAAQRSAAGLILESTFSSARDVAERVYPFLPVRWLMRTSFRSIDTLRSLSIPTLHIHGGRDEIVDVELGRRLYEAAPGPKEWYEIAGAGHNDTFLVGDAEYLRRVADFSGRYARH